jgi:hypothetical protein
MAISPITARGRKSRRIIDQLEASLMKIQLPVALYLIPSQLSRGKTNHDFRLATMQVSRQEVAQWLQVLLAEVDRAVLWNCEMSQYH